MPKAVQNRSTQPEPEMRFNPLRFFSDAEVAELLGVKQRRVRHWRDTGVIGFTKLPNGRETRITGAHLNEWLDRQDHPAADLQSNGGK